MTASRSSAKAGLFDEGLDWMLPKTPLGEPCLEVPGDDTVERRSIRQAEAKPVWKQSHPEAVRQYRVEERLARAEAKMTKRDKRRAAAKR